MVELLNKDLAGEYQAIIAYTVYSQTMKGAKYLHIAKELEKHASEELSHALQIAKQIDYFNGTPVMQPREVKLSDKPEERLRFDRENFWGAGVDDEDKQVGQRTEDQVW